jgi:hypothetical protein
VQRPTKKDRADKGLSARNVPRHKSAADERSMGRSGSEAKNRAEGDTQVVVRSVVEADFVTDVEAQADRSQMGPQSAAGIKHAGNIVGAQAVDAAQERSHGGGSRVEAEVDKAAFQRDERWMAWWPILLFGPNVMEPVLVSVNPSVKAWLKS